MDYATLELLSHQHPAWQILRADHAPLVIAFLQRTFIGPNVRTLPEAELVEALEDQLFAVREQKGEQAFPRDAKAYLNDWARSERGWLRKFYPQGSDEPHYDLTPATEKAISWLTSLTERTFVGTESRLLTLFELLNQVAHGSEPDAAARIEELKRRRGELDEQIARIESGDVPLLDDTAVKERFQQFTILARELLADFREVEHNFRMLDRQVRERIATWEGGKGGLLEEIIADRDLIGRSDQGRSFRAFWELLMSQARQDELTELLDKVLELPQVRATGPEPRLRRVHYDWLEAGQHTQRTVAQLSQQLRRFLDDQAWLENRRIMEILRQVEGHALAVREAAPEGQFMSVAATAPTVELPMERRLYALPLRPVFDDAPLQEGSVAIDPAELFAQTAVNPAELAARIRKALHGRSQLTLGELVHEHPLQHGLAELVAYLQLAGERHDTVIDDETREVIEWRSHDDAVRHATLPRVIFTRGG